MQKKKITISFVDQQKPKLPICSAVDQFRNRFKQLQLENIAMIKNKTVTTDAVSRPFVVRLTVTIYTHRILK